MSLNLSKLEKVRELAGGALQARCPACAEAGQDRKGEHLRVYPDGRFGCCVFAGDREHRKRIFALAGERGRQAISVKVAPKNSGSSEGGILGRIGQVFQSAMNEQASRTARTPEPESSQSAAEDSRTDRTGCSLLTRITNDSSGTEKNSTKLIECAEPVRTVREDQPGEKLPYITPAGDL